MDEQKPRDVAASEEADWFGDLVATSPDPKLADAARVSRWFVRLRQDPWALDDHRARVAELENDLAAAREMVTATERVVEFLAKYLEEAEADLRTGEQVLAQLKACATEEEADAVERKARERLNECLCKHDREWFKTLAPRLAEQRGARRAANAMLADERPPAAKIPTTPAPLINDLLARLRPQARPRESRPSANGNGNVSKRGSPAGKARPRQSEDDDPDLASNGRPSALQAALVGVVAEIERWRETWPPRDYVVLLDLLLRWLEGEYGRAEKRRWL